MSHELAAGTVIAGRYTVVRLLGRGATKLVYLADDGLSGTQVALALLKQDTVAADPTLAARFSREARAASVLRSPYTVRVFDVGKLADGTRYLVTEAVLGRDLADALRKGPLPAPLAARFALHVLAALGEAHARGVLHRDVKPENVLLAPAGPDGLEVARLTDFGLAKVLDGALEGSVMLRTAQNIVLGTPDYMPPEQWQGGPIDHRSDLYAVGVMLYEMLTGRAPFESKAIHAVCIGHMTQPPPPFPAHVSDEARILEPVVQRALGKRPAERFQSADEMRAALEMATGVTLPVWGEPTDRVLAGRSARAELVCEAWPGAVRLVASPSVLLGRDEGCHVRVQCLPASEENVARSRSVSRHHAQIDWRGGRALITDLGSASGTAVGAVPVGAVPVELKNGDEVALGPHVRFAFEHAPCAAGELPRWARLVRIDPSGSGQVDVLVLSEAKISSASDAAVWVPPGRAGGDMLRVRAEGGGLAVVTLGSPQAMPLTDGQTLRLGSLAISVAVES